MKLTQSELRMLYNLVAHATDQYYCDLMDNIDFSVLHGPDEQVKEKLKSYPCDLKKYATLESLYNKLKEAAHVKSDKLWN